MPSINPIPAATQQLIQAHLSSPDRIARLQQQMHITILTDSAGWLTAVKMG